MFQVWPLLLSTQQWFPDHSRSPDSGDSSRVPQVEAERKAASLGLGGSFRRAKSTLGAAQDLVLDVPSTSVSALHGEVAY